MKLQKTWIFVAVSCVAFLWASAATAGDFDWTRDFNIRAEADPSGFRARIATRFHVGDAEINAVIGNTGSPSDAYMVFRLGEMSSRPPEYVMDRYRTGKKKGWGALAKSLGIKPGSSEFHALKRGDDIYYGNATSKGKDKGSKGKGFKEKGNKGKWKEKGKDKG